jgi:spore germination cell wall hydrolase CwlJ-like protein
MLAFTISTDATTYTEYYKPIVKEKVGLAPYARVLDEKELKCLTDNVYFEAGNQKDIGMKAVALTTLNRLRHEAFPNTICKVVHQRIDNVCQFSWTCYKYRRISDFYNYHRAKKIAKLVLINYNYMYDVTKGATFFHRNDIRPTWANPRKRTIIIGRHLFYKL